jgi:alpha-L-arabinofuranosidase
MGQVTNPGRIRKKNDEKEKEKEKSMTTHLSRRSLLKDAALGTVAAMYAAGEGAAGESARQNALVVNPDPDFDLSPWRYMQFMEPLGATDGSVAFAWDNRRRAWKRDIVSMTKQLAPPMMRWGGCFSSYYRWREGVGPRKDRIPMENLLWGGCESNQAGTVEFVDFCTQAGADPLMCVNFESDGRRRWMKDSLGRSRTAGPGEAAAWVSYCNDPGDRLRISHGIEKPCRIPVWQLGNETSYDGFGFDCDTAARKTIEFAKVMRKADPTIDLIGWGDSGWAPRMIEVAGEHLQYIAFHHMYNPGGRKDSVLKGTEYRKDPERTWAELMEAWRPHAAKIKRVREETDGSGIPLALTECHFSLQGPNRCHVLSSWAAGVAMARLLNLHTRNGDVLKIATAADFCGTTWQVNALMTPDRQRPYLMPVGRVMQLYRAHAGKQAIKVSDCPDGLDVTASRTANRVFLHVINTNRTRSITSRLSVAGMAVQSGSVYEIAADPEFEVWSETRDVIAPVRKELPANGKWTFPAASVSAVEMEAIV